MTGGRWRFLGSRRWWLGVLPATALLVSAALPAAALLAPAGAAADLVRVGDINVPRLASALKRGPVQMAGRPDPALTPAEVRALDARIRKVDRGRIWIAVVSPVDPHATGDLAQALANAVVPAGVMIVVAGGNYHVTTTWGSGTAAGDRLSRAVTRPGDLLPVQLRRAIDIFAAADAAAGHPGANSTESHTPAGAPGTTSTTGAPRSAPASGSHQSGGSGGLIALLVVGAVVLLPAAVLGSRAARRRMRASRWSREEQADARSQADADLVKLGEDIGALDIDSSMPNASAQGKDEYGKAIECYQDAERRLKSAGDAYQFERGREALTRGREHVQAAAALFAGARHVPTAPQPTLDGAALEKLEQLAALHDRGALSDEEFAEQKHLLLGD